LLHESTTPQLLKLANQNQHCLNIVLNFIVADITGKRPIKIARQSHMTEPEVSTATLLQINQERVACMNMAANIYGHVPLLSSVVRADPVLYKDNVSILRKEFRLLEHNY